MRTVDEQRRTWRRVSRALRDEAARYERRHPVGPCPAQPCTLHAGHRGTHYDSLNDASFGEDGRRGQEASR